MQDNKYLTREQHDVLLAVFEDCREFYENRRAYDSDYKSLSRASLNDLYTDWKSINAQLVSGEVPRSSVLPEFPYAAAYTPRGVRALRQVLGLYSRLEGSADSESAIMSYRDRVSATRSRCPEPYADLAKSLLATWLGPCPVLMDLFPKHGPGAVAEGLKQYEKVIFNYTFRQLDAVGGTRLLYLNDRHETHEPRDLRILKHPITRVIVVPKDFKKPRIISAEPQTMQFLQQGVARYLMDKLEMSCPFLNFRDQTTNAQLSREFLSVATLDMSDASDLVSRRIVKQLFPADWADLLFALRSRFARLPNETVVPLRCFAPMGSALCFPVESLVFAAITGAVLNSIDRGHWFSKEKRKLFRVYGDDIIVPLESASAVLGVLTACGFTPNKSKCCYKGQFRESCGAEWYQGHDVTVVRPRTLNPLACTLGRVRSEQMPMALHATALYQRGFLVAASALARLCEFPVAIGERDGCVPSALPWPWPGELRWNKALQRTEQETTVAVQAARGVHCGNSYAALFLALASGWSSEQVLTPRIKPKRKWVSASPLMER